MYNKNVVQLWPWQERRFAGEITSRMWVDPETLGRYHNVYGIILYPACTDPDTAYFRIYVGGLLIWCTILYIYIYSVVIVCHAFIYLCIIYIYSILYTHIRRRFSAVEMLYASSRPPPQTFY